jgi:hypothetical protein
LSRSATASGTIIVQSFSPRIITCGASGYFRQEFCELELLDEITNLRYEGKLPDHIEGNLRNSLIRAYQKWKGTDYVPPLIHPPLKWAVKDPMPILPVVTDAPWWIIDKKKTKESKIETTNIQSGFVAAKGSVPVKFGEKRKPEEAEDLGANAKKSKAAQIIYMLLIDWADLVGYQYSCPDNISGCRICLFNGQNTNDQATSQGPLHRFWKVDFEI